MNVVDQATIRAFHQARIGDFGAGTVRALGWKTPSSQQVRFDVLSGIANLDGCTVLDVGCGYGDLRAHLGRLYPKVKYVGIDQMKDFIEVAVKNYGDLPDTAFYLGDFSSVPLTQVDYVLASGAMGYRSSDPDFVLQTITRLFAACRFGFGFNMLSRVENPDGILAAHDPESVLSHCRGLANRVVFRDDYLDDDFAVFMYR